MTVDLLPAGAVWHVEGAVERRSLSPLLSLLLAAPLGELVGDDPLPLGIELVRGVLEEEHPEYELVVGGVLHGATQDVGRREEVALKLGKGQSWHVSYYSSPFRAIDQGCIAARWLIGSLQPLQAASGSSCSGFSRRPDRAHCPSPPPRGAAAPVRCMARLFECMATAPAMDQGPWSWPCLLYTSDAADEED